MKNILMLHGVNHNMYGHRNPKFYGTDTLEDINAAIAYCDMEIDVRQQAISAVIWDTMTGEIYATCSWNEDDIDEEDYSSWDDDVDESNYDPYAGCDMYEVEPFDY